MLNGVAYTEAEIQNTKAEIERTLQHLIELLSTEN